MQMLTKSPVVKGRHRKAKDPSITDRYAMTLKLIVFQVNFQVVSDVKLKIMFRFNESSVNTHTHMTFATP